MSELNDLLRDVVAAWKEQLQVENKEKAKERRKRIIKEIIDGSRRTKKANIKTKKSSTKNTYD